MRTTTSLAATLLFAAFAGGCIPHVGHGPRVEPGASYHITASLSRSTDLQDYVQIAVLPSVYVGGNRGWVWDNGMAASVGVQLPPLLLPVALLSNEADLGTLASLFLGDVYVQPARSADGSLDYGIGTMFSRAVIAPYVQFGRGRDGGYFTTQQFAYTHGDFNPYVYWLPSFSHRSARGDGSRVVDYFVSGAVGWPQKERIGATRSTEWFISLGVVAELRGRR